MLPDYYENIYKDITSQFHALWKTRPRGKSLEIITPFSTMTGHFITVFLRKDDNKWVITDGGTLAEFTYFEYNENSDMNVSLYFNIIEFFQKEYDIKRVEVPKRDKVLYYLSTNDDKLVANIVNDLCCFINSVISAYVFAAS